jgi:putative two-component system response regulator
MNYWFDITSAKIIIVDDVSTNREILERVLEKEGYNISQSKSGEAALKIIPRSLPDLILLDVTMPGIDGFETCRRLKEDKATRNIPVLFISARENLEDITKGFRVGGVDYITKPFQNEEVRKRVKIHLTLKLSKEALLNQNKILEDKVKERTKELSETRLEIITRLGRAAEYRDIPGFHTTRVSHYCALLGHACSLDEKNVDLLLHAGAVHDVGKVGIPDKILLKPGKLISDEWEIMKTHVEIGADLLSGCQSDIMQMVYTIALNHHERWDGTGYMKGLKGEEIPLMARICSVCDIFDALTCDRPFRKAFSTKDSMATIEELSGKHLDPKLVKLFKKLFPEIEKIREKYPN